MLKIAIRGMWLSLACVALALAMESTAFAAPYAVGPEKCMDCHRAEHQVWEATKHATSFRDVHRNSKVKAIAMAAGGDDNMRRNATCVSCHYSETQKDANARPAISVSISCESCHGAASDWITLHNDYGGPTAKRETETPDHKVDRLNKAAAAGMVHPANLFDIASNCLSCHGATRDSVAPDTMAKMIDAGHPPGSDFELVKYSQGTVRHRFYPPNVTANAEMTPPELARTFITGHAAALVKVTTAAATTNPKLKATRDTLANNARAALTAIQGQVPEAGALLAAPNEANARKLVDAIASKDLSAAVASLLPAKTAYK